MEKGVQLDYSKVRKGASSELARAYLAKSKSKVIAAGSIILFCDAV